MRLLSLLMLMFAVVARSETTVFDLADHGVPAGGYSGIAHMGGDRYAVVSDTDKGGYFRVWQIGTDGGKMTVRDISPERPSTPLVAGFTDQEGICFDTRDSTLWIASEGSQRVVEMRRDGRPTGRELPIPEAFGTTGIQANRGFEALTYEGRTHSIFVATESNLKTDSAGVVRLLAFSLDSLDRAPRMYQYRVDNPQATGEGRGHYHGLSAMTALPDGRLVVLEREAFIKEHYLGSRCWCKLYRVELQDGVGEGQLQKELLDTWQTTFGLFDLSFANYEGMCLIPQGDEAEVKLLLVSDSQNGYGVRHWHLKDWMKVEIVKN